MFPVLQQPNPIAQKWRPQYLFFSSGNSCCSFRELRPFNFLTRSLTLSEGRYSICMWTWSLETTPFRIDTSCASQIWMNRVRQRIWVSPFRTEYLYLVLHTTWTLSRETVCPLLLTSAMEQKLVFLEAKARCTKVHLSLI